MNSWFALLMTGPGSSGLLAFQSEAAEEVFCPKGNQQPNPKRLSHRSKINDRRRVGLSEGEIRIGSLPVSSG
ncbi:MAG: hypothetical protein IPG76_23085 [Acidobacteria bacterium]|nr:hypothetical protein [Acidobacteriota bacterium]